MFGHASLRGPDDFAGFAGRHSAHAARLVVGLVEPPPGGVVGTAGSGTACEVMDEISVSLCEAVDAAELCRNAHSDPAWREEASKAVAELQSYLADLNADERISEAMAVALRDVPMEKAGEGRAGDEVASAPAVPEERVVLESLLMDAYRGGVAVPEEMRADVKALVLRGIELAVEFSTRIVEAGVVGPVVVRRRPVEEAVERYGVRPELFSLLDVVEEERAGPDVPEERGVASADTSGDAACAAGASNEVADAAAMEADPTDEVLGEEENSADGDEVEVELTAAGDVLRWMLLSVGDGETRRRIYTAVMTQQPENLATLDAMLDSRHGLAQTLGYQSYSQMIAETGLTAATSPAAVRDTLERLADLLRPAGDREIARLAEAKAADASPSTRAWDWGEFEDPQSTRSDGGSGTSSGAGGGGCDLPPPIFIWDRPYYEEQLRAAEHQKIMTSGEFSKYLSVEDVRGGLFDLTRRLLGVRVERVGLRPSEAWAPGTQVSKYALVEEADALRGESLLGHIYLDLFGRPAKNGHPSLYGLASSRRIPPGSPQAAAQRAAYGDRAPADKALTQSALVMGLNPTRVGRPEGGLDSVLMTWFEAKDLFHEWGHALHHALSATTFQHLSGTRAAMDWIEVPSTLLEHFFKDARVAEGFMRHVRTGEPLPEGAFAEALRRDSAFSALVHQDQVGLALVDLDLHAPETRRPSTPPWDKSSVTTSGQYSAIMDSVCSVATADGTFPFTRASHYVGYPGQYYSYIYARCLAAQLWSGLFAADPFSRAAGDKFRGLLAPGGARPPLDLFRDALGGQGPSLRAFVENVAGPDALAGVPDADLRLRFHAYD